MQRAENSSLLRFFGKVCLFCTKPTPTASEANLTILGNSQPAPVRPKRPFVSMLFSTSSAKLLYQFLNEWKVKDQFLVTTKSADRSSTGRLSSSTLTPTDLAVSWRGPQTRAEQVTLLSTSGAYIDALKWLRIIIAPATALPSLRWISTPKRSIPRHRERFGSATAKHEAQRVLA
jgi:hypothetical protein